MAKPTTIKAGDQVAACAYTHLDTADQRLSDVRDLSEGLLLLLEAVGVDKQSMRILGTMVGQIELCNKAAREELHKGSDLVHSLAHG